MNNKVDLLLGKVHKSAYWQQDVVAKFNWVLTSQHAKVEHWTITLSRAYRWLIAIIIQQ